ncbi:MAG: hypothetical protein RLZZ528_261, partial [Pseudomonadota bacterium]
RDPLEAVREGRFREDLYYRLHVVPIHMPPLRDRGADVIAIAEGVLKRFAREEGRRFQALDSEVRDLFLKVSWPGNVRQLLNVVRNVVVLNDGEIVSRGMLPPGLGASSESPARRSAPQAAPGGIDALIGRTLAEIERIVIEETIARNGGSVPKAARILAVAPSTIYRKMEGWTDPQTARG